MTVTVSYPGVYVQELPAGSHSITGVATSITAFIGRAARGPLDQAITINSQPDYDRTFGGLDANSPMSFAVRDFYLNGGSQAVIARVFRNDGTTTAATAVISVGAVFKLVAANPGSWGRTIAVELDEDVADSMLTTLSPDPSDPSKKLKPGQVFNVKVTYGNTVELHRNVTMLKSSRRIDLVLAAESDLVRFPPLATDPPNANISITSAAPETFESAVTSAVNTAWANSDPTKKTVKSTNTTAVQDGTYLQREDYTPSNPDAKTGFRLFDQVDLFNLLIVPPNKLAADAVSLDLEPIIAGDAVAYAKSRRAVAVFDSPSTWTSKKAAKDGLSTFTTSISDKSYAALYFPRVGYPNPFDDDRIGSFGSAGLVAGIIARTDADRGVWKAPAGLEAAIGGILELEVNLTDLENGELNPLAINCLRTKPGAGPVVWGARTLDGDDRVSSQWKYLPVRRTALFLEESLFRGTQWVVFEPNDEPLWAQIRTTVGAFMQSLFLQGAFQGQTPDEAYFVKCDEETTSQTDIDNGIVNILVGFAPLKPAEFVVLSLQQIAGQQAGG